MSLTPGQMIGHYEIKGAIGKGGMGEVYRATDGKLGRDVAVKVLPAGFAADPERLARFRREAQTLAVLQHPNVASIYGLESEDDHTFLVMELCEGEDLAVRLKRGALLTEDVVRIAGQIAAGLEEAHDNGIVHRDLKPANIMLGPDGKVKILDFGLARAMGDTETTQHDSEHSPTLTAAFTSPGVILGTAAYMSPEQARGQNVDKRTDIWAFGVIIREMLTGERLFAGETVSDTLAAVLTRDVDLDALPETTPPSLRHVLVRCLERDPKKRLRDIGEARLLLADPEASSFISRPALPADPRTSRRKTLAWLPWLLAVAALAAALPAWMGAGEDDVAPRPVRRFTIEAALPRLYNTRAVEISPDGTQLAIFAHDGLWIRDLDQIEPRLLVDAADLTFNEVGVAPFWSPDGSQIGYGANGRLLKIAAGGGSPQVVCTLPGDWMGGAWGADGTIVFSTTRGPMYQVAARGGDPVLLLEPSPDHELDFHQPAFVWDGGGFLYAVHRVEGVDTIELMRDGKRTMLLRVEGATRDDVQVVNNPVFSPSGHVLYQRSQGNSGLWALPFDAATGTATGEPFLIRSQEGHPSVSRDGTLIHMPMADVNMIPGQLVAVSRAGELLATLTELSVGIRQPAYSPDGTRIAYSAQGGQDPDIFVLDRASGLSTQLTLTPGLDGSPAWIPGTNKVAYTAPAGDCPGIWSMNADGSGRPELVMGNASRSTFTPDARELVATSMCERERGLIRYVVGGDEEPVFVRSSPAGIDYPELSPDGRFLSYNSWESGDATLEVMDYPGPGGRRVMASSESVSRWRGDGRELYFVTRQPYKMMAVALEPGDAFVVKSSTVLFDLDPLGLDSFADFDVSPDGREFVFLRTSERDATRRSFTVVENWFEDFRED